MVQNRLKVAGLRSCVGVSDCSMLVLLHCRFQHPFFRHVGPMAIR